jgi:hypothetical protein
MTRKRTVEQRALLLFKQILVDGREGLHLTETVLPIARRVRVQAIVELFPLMRAFFRPWGSLIEQGPGDQTLNEEGI